MPREPDMTSSSLGSPPPTVSAASEMTSNQSYIAMLGSGLKKRAKSTAKEWLRQAGFSGSTGTCQPECNPLADEGIHPRLFFCVLIRYSPWENRPRSHQGRGSEELPLLISM